MGMTLPPIVSSTHSIEFNTATESKGVQKESSFVINRFASIGDSLGAILHPPSYLRCSSSLGNKIVTSRHPNYQIICTTWELDDTTGVSLGTSHTRANPTPRGCRCKIIEKKSQYISKCFACLLSLSPSVLFCEAPINQMFATRWWAT